MRSRTLQFVKLFSAILTGGILVFTGGCTMTSPPNNYYLLSPLSQTNMNTMNNPADSAALGILSVQLPDYTDRPQIVTRVDKNRVHFAEFDRWAEPLQNNISMVLGENLAILLGTDHVALYPWKAGTPIDYQVAVNIKRFIGSLNGDAILIVRWHILDKNGQKILLTKQSEFKQKVPMPTYDALVQAMNQNIADLSREIATAIRSVRASE